MQHQDLIELNLRRGLLSQMPQSAVTAASLSCQASCTELARRTQQLEQHRIDDLASVVGAVHDTIAALGAEMASWQDDVQASVRRFDASVSQPDLERLRAQLLDEVRMLRSVVTDRRRRWDETKRAYAERVTDLELQLRTTRVEALTDGLTGLANRRAFDRELARRLRSSQQRVVLALCDVDDFKGVNDTKGHAAGDRLLIAIAQVLEGAMRPGDLVARIGGDEFAVIAAGLTLRQAECRFSTLVSELRVSTHGVSCGLAEFSAGDTVKSLCDRADAALYDAKRGGKNRVGTRSQAYLRKLKGGSRAVL